MKKIGTALVSVCIALGSSGAFATENAKKLCDDVSNYSSNTPYPKTLDKYTVQNAYESSYKSDVGTCVITVNYEFDADKFVSKLVEITGELDKDDDEVARLFLESDIGDSVIRQMIMEEYGPKYEGLKQENVDIFMHETHAFKFGSDNDNRHKQYFNLYDKAK